MGNLITHPPFDEHKEKDVTYRQLTRHLHADDVLYQYLKKQYDKGREKYEAPVTKDAYTLDEWFNHLREELTDACVYNDMIRQHLCTVDDKEADEISRRIHAKIRHIDNTLRHLFEESEQLYTLQKTKGERHETNK